MNKKGRCVVQHIVAVLIERHFLPDIRLDGIVPYYDGLSHSDDHQELIYATN